MSRNKRVSYFLRQYLFEMERLMMFEKFYDDYVWVAMFFIRLVDISLRFDRVEMLNTVLRVVSLLCSTFF